jgi:(R,R)-butanediol dehydrogenase/meso-butanediol dehydrogenase/diacetyl reductase
MRAAVFHGRRDVRIEDVGAVGAPGRDEVVLDVVRAAICGTDATEWAHGPKMSSLDHPHHVTHQIAPVVLGHEFVGIVRDAGDDVTDVRPGDRVVPGCGAWCGTCVWCHEGQTQLCRDRYLIGMHRDGGLAEAVVVPAKMCLPVATSTSDEAAAIAQPLAVAIHGLENGHVTRGPIVVIGAGGIGTLVIAAAHVRGIGPIIVIDINQARLDCAASLGADHLFMADDPRLKAQITELTAGDGPEVVVEASGAPSAPAMAAGLVRPGGRIVLMGMQSAPRELNLFALAQWEVQVLPSNAHICGRDLPAALHMLESSDLADRVIGSRIGLSRLVADGLQPLADGTATGKIVIDPQG